MHENIIPYFAPIDDVSSFLDARKFIGTLADPNVTHQNFAIPHFIDNASNIHQWCGSDPNCLPSMRPNGHWDGDYVSCSFLDARKPAVSLTRT